MTDAQTQSEKNERLKNSSTNNDGQPMIIHRIINHHHRPIQSDIDWILRYTVLQNTPHITKQLR